jgi:hypothetical protein
LVAWPFGTQTCRSSSQARSGSPRNGHSASLVQPLPMASDQLSGDPSGMAFA